MTSFDVTRRAVSYGAYDTYTGWPAKSYAESTIKMPIYPKGASFSAGGIGFYAQYDHTGFTSDVVADGDEIEDSFGNFYRVNTHTPWTRGSTFEYYICDLIRLEPHHDRAATSGTWHLDSTAALTDPRYRHKYFIQDAITATNIKKDDGATNAGTHVMFDEPDFHWIHLFSTLAKDVVFMVSRGDCTSLLQYNKVPYAFNESCTVTIYAINKATVTAVNVIEQAEQELRHIITDTPHVAGYTVRSLDHIKNFTSKVGGVMVYGTQLELKYIRVNHDFTPTKPTISYGNGFVYDGEEIASLTETNGGSNISYTVDEGTYLRLHLSAYVGDAYYKNTTALALDTTVYTKIRWRYKTWSTAKAKIVLTFSDASTQTVLANSSSTTFTVGTATITTSKTLQYISLYAAAATGIVWYDFVQVYKADFIFCNASNISIPEIPLRDASLPVIGLIGDYKESLGSEDAKVTIACNLDFGNWKRTLDSIDGQIFLELQDNFARDQYSSWHWLNYAYGQMKVRYVSKSLSMRYSGEGTHIDLEFTEYGQSNTLESTETRFGIDL